MVKEKVKNIINKENAKKLVVNKKYLPWVIAGVLAFLFLDFFGVVSTNYCAKEEIVELVGELAEEIDARITGKGAEKIARDGKTYYCEAPVTNKEGRTLKYTVHILDEGFWAELGHNFK